MEKFKDLLKEYNLNEKRRSYPAWQLWALEFCKKYDIDRKEYGTIMKYAKKYSDKLDYLRGIDGWISDYPNLRGKVVKLFLWKLAEDKKQRVGNDYV